MLLHDAQFAHGEFSSRTLADRAFRRVKSTPSKGKDRDRMGEAKRRMQQPAKRTETVIELDEQTNEERRVETIVRDGGSVSTFLKKGLNGVPCNGCRMCCYHPRIEVEPQDDVRHLDIETHEDGGQTLRRREDGSCVHLGPEGCTVYAHRPRGCQTYDCRLFSLLSIVETAVPVPHWTFSARTREEKAVLFALHMKVVEHSRSKRVTHEVLQDIITGYEEHLPFAREMLTNMERMTTAEREAFIAGNSSRDSKKT